MSGLILGWLGHRISDSWLGHAPVVSLSQPIVLFVLAAILGWIAWATRRALLPDPEATSPRGRLEPHQAVNRLVLARACALVGALVAGLYFGYAVSWLDVDVELAHQRLVRSVAAGVGACLVVLASVLLERACRVRGDDPEA